MLRPACLLERLANPCHRLAPATGPPVYGRACPSQGLPRPESAITTRPNHPLPRQDFHLQVCPSLKAAHKKLLFHAHSRSSLDVRRLRSIAFHPGSCPRSYPPASRCQTGTRTDSTSNLPCAPMATLLDRQPRTGPRESRRRVIVYALPPHPNPLPRGEGVSLPAL